MKYDSHLDIKLYFSLQKSLPKLKSFSLISHIRTRGYDNSVVPLLHRMSSLEKLIISLSIQNRTSFIDRIHLNNEIQSRMPYLSTFIFNILTYNVQFFEDDRPSSDDIRHTFIEGTSFDCYVDYNLRGQGRCHSIAFNSFLWYYKQFSWGSVHTCSHFECVRYNASIRT